MTETSSPTIQASTKLGDLVNDHPQLAPALERMQLDYCCGGQRTLAAACAEADIDVGEAVDTLARTALAAPTSTSTLPDLVNLTPSALADHIEQTHHAYLRGELPRLAELAERVLAVHGDRHPELAEVQDAFEVLRADLQPHLVREEQILFPLIREIDAALRADGWVNGEVKNPVGVLQDDHEQVGALLARLHELTNSFTTPEDGCASYRALCDGLRRLADDTHLHVHKENNILFPAAIEHERRLHRPTSA
jgi:regulator of cell morphogenesis and NO signaling